MLHLNKKRRNIDGTLKMKFQVTTAIENGSEKTPHILLNFKATPKAYIYIVLFLCQFITQLMCL